MRIKLQTLERSPKLSEMKIVYRRQKNPDRKKIADPVDVQEYLRGIWNRDTLELIEDVIVVCLNGSHETLGWVKVSTGGMGSCIVDPRVVFGVALQAGSTAIILGHNHPGGSLIPSREDLALTRRLKEAGNLLNIPLLDHVIVTKDGAVSLLEKGLL